MSMHSRPIMLFGVNTKDIGIKPEYWQGYGDKDIPDDIEPRYDDINDFIDEAIDDWRIGCEENEYDTYIGVFPCYEWQVTSDKPFKNANEARQHIAKALAPYCNSTEEEIAKACDYIEDTYCG